MSMNKIDGSQLLPSRQLDGSHSASRNPKTEAESALLNDGVKPTKSAVSGDTAQISDKARKLMEMRHAFESGLVAVGKEPEVREEKLSEVRLRLEQGYYNSVEVREKMSEGILKAFEGMDKL